MSKGRHVHYSADDLAWLEANRLLPIGDYHRAFCEASGREDVTAANLHSLRKRMGWKTGRTGHFAPGSAPANKGKVCPPGTGGRHPNAKRTQFRKGAPATGRAAEVYKPIGTERISKSGYLERKINDDMPLQARWRAVHLLRWEAIHGPIPSDHCLKCLNTDKLDTDPANWELIPRALLPLLSGGRRKTRPAYGDVEPELRPALLTAAKIKHRVRQLRDQT